MEINLTLFVLRVLTDDSDGSLSLNDLALLADRLTDDLTSLEILLP